MSSFLSFCADEGARGKRTVVGAPGDRRRKRSMGGHALISLMAAIHHKFYNVFSDKSLRREARLKPARAMQLGPSPPAKAGGYQRRRLKPAEHLSRQDNSSCVAPRDAALDSSASAVSSLARDDGLDLLYGGVFGVVDDVIVILIPSGEFHFRSGEAFFDLGRRVRLARLDSPFEFL